MHGRGRDGMGEGMGMHMHAWGCAVVDEGMGIHR